MATQTEKLGLLKPTYDEPADIDVLNGNMDKIDDFAKDISELKPNVAEITSAGWYRVAQINNSACSFSMKIYEHSNEQTYPEMYDLNINVAQAINGRVIINIVQTNSNRPHDTQKIQKIRVVTNKSLIHYVEIYLADSSLLTMVKVHNLYPNNVLSYLNFKNGSVPSGYTATEFTLSSNPVKTSKFEGDLIGNADSADKLGMGFLTGSILSYFKSLPAWATTKTIKWGDNARDVPFDWGTAIIHKTDAGYGTIIATSYDDGSVAVCEIKMNVMQGWKQIATTDEVEEKAYLTNSEFRVGSLVICASSTALPICSTFENVYIDSSGQDGFVWKDVFSRGVYNTIVGTWTVCGRVAEADGLHKYLIQRIG